MLYFRLTPKSISICLLFTYLTSSMTNLAKLKRWKISKLALSHGWVHIFSDIMTKYSILIFYFRNNH